jgi:signal transduction histidine kinase/CheY-like chemotaxis protein
VKPSPTAKIGRLISVRIAGEPDVVIARQRARQIAGLLGFGRQDQVQIATAVSEIARNAWQYAAGGVVLYSVNLHATPMEFLIEISDSGPGIADLDKVLEGSYRSTTGMGLGLVGARRLMDRCEVRSEVGKGTTVLLSRNLPAVAVRDDLRKIASRLAAANPLDAVSELQEQNHDLLSALDTLQQRELELRRLNQELEDTNRGVVALYAELDEKAASLRRADELKSRFLSHMSHEFRTPLNSIVALARLLESRVDGELTPEQSRQIGYIHKAAEELQDMVNDLLDLAKVEAGKVDLQITEFALTKLFGTLRGMMRPLLTNDAVSLTFEPPEPDLLLRTDEGKVSQILRNLVSNALKFTERGEVRVYVSQGEGDISLWVSDTGIGIAPEAQEVVFQEFGQVQNRLQRKVRGTGLGLPLSRKLAELLGGTLTVASVVGHGSDFRFCLPASVLVIASSSGSHSTVLPSFSQMREADTVLVVDDDEVTRYLVKQLLRQSGFAITEAEGGATGLERARFDRPRGILLDLNMPGLNGFEVLEELRSDPETREIPIIIYTARRLTDVELQRLAMFGVPVISKQDMASQQFVKTVEEVFGRGALSADRKGG